MTRISKIQVRSGYAARLRLASMGALLTFDRSHHESQRFVYQQWSNIPTMAESAQATRSHVH